MPESGSSGPTPRRPCITPLCRTCSVASFEFDDDSHLESQRLLEASRKILYRVVCERVLHANVQIGHFAQRVARAHERYHVGGSALVASIPFDDPDALA